MNSPGGFGSVIASVSYDVIVFTEFHILREGRQYDSANCVASCGTQSCRLGLVINSSFCIEIYLFIVADRVCDLDEGRVGSGGFWLVGCLVRRLVGFLGDGLED